MRVTVNNVKARKPRPLPDVPELRDDEVEANAEALFRKDVVHVEEKTHQLEMVDIGIPFSPDMGKIFYDEANAQLIVANANTITTIPFDAGTGNQQIDMLQYINPKFGSILSIKRSPRIRPPGQHRPPDPHIGIQLNDVQVEFTNLRTKDAFTKSVGKNKKLIRGFFWTKFHDIVIITTITVELYQYSISQGMKLVKETRHGLINWFLFDPRLQFLIVNTGNEGRTLQLYQFSASGTYQRYPKFVSEWNSPLLARNVHILILYKKVFIAMVKPDSQAIMLYDFPDGFSGGLSKHMSDFHVHRTSDIRIQVVENLVVVHDLGAKASMIYDIKERRSFPCTCPMPLLYPKAAMAPLYTQGWNYLSPSYILDMNFGKVYQIQLVRVGLASGFIEKKYLISFLLRIRGTTRIILSIMRRLIRDKMSLSYLADVFDGVNKVLVDWMKESRYQKVEKEKERESEGDVALRFDGSPDVRGPTTAPVTGPISLLKGEVDNQKKQEDDGIREVLSTDGRVVIQQSTMYTNVLFVNEEAEEEAGGPHHDYRYLVSVLVEYIRSLNFHRISPEFFLYELVINCLVRCKKYYQLHQLIQYHVVEDSVQVACQLLSLENVYPPAYQLAMDMFKRLSAHDQIVEVLLSHGYVLPALRVARKQNIRTIPIMRFLEVSYDMQDKHVFFTVFRFLQIKNKIPLDRAQAREPYQKFYDLFSKEFPDVERE